MSPRLCITNCAEGRIVSAYAAWPSKLIRPYLVFASKRDAGKVRVRCITVDGEHPQVPRGGGNIDSYVQPTVEVGQRSLLRECDRLQWEPGRCRTRQDASAAACTQRRRGAVTKHLLSILVFIPSPRDDSPPLTLTRLCSSTDGP